MEQLHILLLVFIFYLGNKKTKLHSFTLLTSLSYPNMMSHISYYFVKYSVSV